MPTSDVHMSRLAFVLGWSGAGAGRFLLCGQKLNCNKSLPAGAKVNTTNFRLCALPYITVQVRAPRAYVLRASLLASRFPHVGSLLVRMKLISS